MGNLFIQLSLQERHPIDLIEFKNANVRLKEHRGGNSTNQTGRESFSMLFCEGKLGCQWIRIKRI